MANRHEGVKLKKSLPAESAADPHIRSLLQAKVEERIALSHHAHGGPHLRVGEEPCQRVGVLPGPALLTALKHAHSLPRTAKTRRHDSATVPAPDDYHVIHGLRLGEEYGGRLGDVWPRRRRSIAAVDAGDLIPLIDPHVTVPLVVGHVLEPTKNVVRELLELVGWSVAAGLGQ